MGGKSNINLIHFFFICLKFFYLQMLAARNIVDGRSWHSLKERFRKPIRKKLESNPNAYDLSQREIQCLLSEFR